MWCRSKRIGMGEGTESNAPAPTPTSEWHMDNALVMFWRCSGVGVCGGAVGVCRAAPAVALCRTLRVVIGGVWDGTVFWECLRCAVCAPCAEVGGLGKHSIWRRLGLGGCIGHPKADPCDATPRGALLSSTIFGCGRACTSGRHVTHAQRLLPPSLFPVASHVPLAFGEWPEVTEFDALNFFALRRVSAITVRILSRHKIS